MSNSTRKCTNCKKRFKQDIEWLKNNVGYFHNEDCLVEYLARAAKRKRLRLKRADGEKRKARKKLKAVLNNLSHEKKLTQAVINKYVRLRDKGLQCISCDKFESDMVGYWDAGHTLSRGSHSQIRFDLRNINGQCRSCNSFKGGMPEQARQGILQRYGQARLDWLDGFHPEKKYSYDDLARMRKIFNKKIKRLL